MPRRLFTFLLLTLCLGAPFFAHAQPDSGSPMVVIQPPSGAYDPGDEFDVEVWVTDVENLYGADIQLAFDPALLAIVDDAITPLDDLLQPDFVVRQQVDNAAGTVWYAVTQLSPTEPASGSGALFGLRFKALGDGVGRVTVSSQTLANRDAEVIPAGSSGAVYQLGSGQFTLHLPVILKK